MDSATEQEPSVPIIIYRSVGRDGQTFGLHPLSADRLKERFGDAIEMHRRVFISHESMEGYQRLLENLAPQIVVLLTGLSMRRLEELGGVSFREPASDVEIELPRAGDRAGDSSGAVADLG